MTEEQAREAILARAPVRIRMLSMMMQEIEYNRIICILPMREGEDVPTVVLEYQSGHSVSYAKLTQIIGGDPYIKEKTPEAACV